MPKAWIQDRKRDYYYRKAREESYRSRATYKLLQAAKKYRFIKEADIVVDLGAAPGGWIQAVHKIVGNRGFVLGVDVRSIEPFSEDNIRTFVGDITEPELIEQILQIIPEKANVVVSDLSPNISGIWEVDHARQIDLAQHALNIAFKTLRCSGNFFVKVFQGDLLDDFVEKVKTSFRATRLVKPQASRTRSSEMFILGLSLDQTNVR